MRRVYAALGGPDRRYGPPGDDLSHLQGGEQAYAISGAARGYSRKGGRFRGVIAGPIRRTNLALNRITGN